MKVFVTGATGFIGLAACQKLVSAGHEVRGLARSREKARIIEEVGVIPILGDLDDPGRAFRQVGPAEAIVNLASPWFVGRETLEQARSIGRRLLEWSRALADWALETNCRLLVHGDGELSYGDHGAERVTEETPHRPIGYGRMSVPAQEHFKKRASENSLPLVLMYPGWVYGPGGWFTGVVREIASGETRHLVDDGSVYLGYVERDDVGEAFRLAVEKARPGSRYNIGDNDPRTVRQFVEETARVLDCPMPRGISRERAERECGEVYLESHVSSTRIVNTRARTDLDWAPRYGSIRDGLPVAVAALRDRGFF